jgi:hypothetical protein
MGCCFPENQRHTTLPNSPRRKLNELWKANKGFFIKIPQDKNLEELATTPVEYISKDTLNSEKNKYLIKQQSIAEKLLAIKKSTGYDFEEEKDEDQLRVNTERILKSTNDTGESEIPSINSSLVSSKNSQIDPAKRLTLEVIYAENILSKKAYVKVLQPQKPGEPFKEFNTKIKTKNKSQMHLFQQIFVLKYSKDTSEEDETFQVQVLTKTTGFKKDTQIGQTHTFNLNNFKDHTIHKLEINLTGIQNSFSNLEEGHLFLKLQYITSPHSLYSVYMETLHRHMQLYAQIIHNYNQTLAETKSITNSSRSEDAGNDHVKHRYSLGDDSQCGGYYGPHLLHGSSPSLKNRGFAYTLGAGAPNGLGDPNSLSHSVGNPPLHRHGFSAGSAAGGNGNQEESGGSDVRRVFISGEAVVKIHSTYSYPDLLNLHDYDNREEDKILEEASEYEQSRYPVCHSHQNDFLADY